MKNLIITAFWAISVLNGLSQDVVINEIAYTNDGLVTDRHGKAPDWFEILNNSGHSINLMDYQVTDDTSKAIYWTFPSHIMQPGEYLVVFASDKDTMFDSEFHTSFRLENMRETLYLINPFNEIIDIAEPSCAPSGYSLGRQPDGSNGFKVIVPTPGTTNDFSESINVNFIQDSLTVSHPSGFYNSPVSVILKQKHPGNKIIYTLDGEVPENDAQIYEHPIYLEDITKQKNRFANKVHEEIEPGNAIFKANILRAVVYSNGCPASNEIVNTYFINESIKGHYKVMVVSLITEEDNLFDDEIGIYTEGNSNNFRQHGSKWERPAHIEIFDGTGKQVIDQDAGMRIHGYGSRGDPQKSLRLYAEKEHGKEYFESALFSQKPLLDKFKILLLRTTNRNFGPLFKEELCNHLIENMNIDYQAGETAILFINGEYWGIYNLMERQNRYYVENNYDISNADVDIISYFFRLTVEEGTVDEYNDLVGYLYSADPFSESFYREIESRIDIDAIIHYYIAQIYFANYDWPLNNLELWKLKNDTAKWRYFFFDLDASMMWLNDDHLTVYLNDIEDYQRFPEFSTVILRIMMKNEIFRKKFYGEFQHHLNTTFNAGRVIAAINKFEKQYAPLVPEHVYRWHNPIDYHKWEESVTWLRTFAIQRPVILTGQLQHSFGDQYQIYPNPGNGKFTVQMINPVESMIVRVFSAKGEVLQQWSYPNVNSNEIHISADLPPGFYIIQIETENSRYSEKLIIHYLP
jgi:hypothetical protein